jgi:hypothetical protein
VKELVNNILGFKERFFFDIYPKLEDENVKSLIQMSILKF